jgi:hypothetical protein
VTEAGVVFHLNYNYRDDPDKIWYKPAIGFIPCGTLIKSRLIAEEL